MSIFIGLGDLHGQVATLDQLRVVQERYPGAITVFIGDYIDTFGENQGFELIEQIRAMQLADSRHVVVLMGNHEQAAADFFDDECKSAWLRFGGENTLTTAALSLGGYQDVMQDRRLLLERKRGLIDWMRALPLTYTAGKLFFVHAGLDLTLADSIHETSDDDLLWIRAKYWYNGSLSWGTFGHNPLNFSLITGHTANGMIMGGYDGQSGTERPIDKQESEHSPIYTIQYPGEMPRYLMDGGVGEGDPRILGNIGVFDGETGLLIDKVEDQT